MLLFVSSYSGTIQALASTKALLRLYQGTIKAHRSAAGIACLCGLCGLCGDLSGTFEILGFAAQRQKLLAHLWYCVIKACVIKP
jgi:hypothetical protein